MGLLTLRWLGLSGHRIWIDCEEVRVRYDGSIKLRAERGVLYECTINRSRRRQSIDEYIESILFH